VLRDRERQSAGQYRSPAIALLFFHNYENFMDTLSHFHLNSGQNSLSFRGEVGSEVIDHFLPVIDAQQGPLPGIDDWYLSLMFPLMENGSREPGAAYFQIADEPGLSIRPAIIGHCCWEPRLTAESWQQTLASYYELQDALMISGMWREAPNDPPKIPWVVEFTLPSSLSDLRILRNYCINAS